MLPVTPLFIYPTVGKIKSTALVLVLSATNHLLKIFETIAAIFPL